MSSVQHFTYPPTPQDWTQIQDEVRALYVQQKLPLKEVRNVLRVRHGFRATERMIKARLKQWGYLKNAKKEDWHSLALLHHQRKGLGKSSTVFDVRGHRKTVKDLQRFVRNQNMSADKFLEEARQHIGNKPIPEYVRAFTPDSGQTPDSPRDDDDVDDFSPSPPQAHVQPIYYPAISNQDQHLHPTRPSNHQRHRSNSANSMGYDSENFEMIAPTSYPSTGSQDLLGISASPSAFNCTQIQTDLEMLSSQLTQPSPIRQRNGENNISSWSLLSSSPARSDSSGRSLQYVCSRCNQPADQHFTSLDSFEPHQAVKRNILNDNSQDNFHLPVSTKEEGSWLWISRCFLACMCFRKGDNEAAEQALREAANEFERLLDRKDSQLLTAAGVVMTVLHMHDQGALSQRVLQSANEVCERKLAEDNAIRMTVRYLTASAAIQQREWGIDCDYMKTIRKKFEDYLAPDHGFVIAARYNYAWMLKFEERLDEAEIEARKVYEISCKVFGKTHMQSITCLAVIAGCIYSKPERLDECIAIFQKVVHRARQTMGDHHPYTLEATRRLAMKWTEKFGRSTQTLSLYWDVVKGRAHMLGPGHTFTQGAKVDYEAELKEMNLWTDTNDQLTQYAVELQTLFAPKSPSTWSRISRRRTSSQQSLPGQFTLDFDDVDLMDNEEVIITDEHMTGSDENNFEAY